MMDWFPLLPFLSIYKGVGELESPQPSGFLLHGFLGSGGHPSKIPPATYRRGISSGEEFGRIPLGKMLGPIIFPKEFFTRIGAAWMVCREVAKGTPRTPQIREDKNPGAGDSQGRAYPDDSMHLDIQVWLVSAAK
jgi:hypothetical protein